MSKLRIARHYSWVYPAAAAIEATEEELIKLCGLRNVYAQHA